MHQQTLIHKVFIHYFQLLLDKKRYYFINHKFQSIYFNIIKFNCYLKNPPQAIPLDAPQANQLQRNIINVQDDDNTENYSIKKLEQVLDYEITSVVMTIITLYALFGDDIRVLVTDKDGDPTFWTLNIIALCAFSLEIICASICKQNYFNGFFFWLDIISTLSLLLDIGWVTQSLFSNSSAAGASSAAQLARAGRASRVGTKAGRIVRIIRLIRLVKLYKQAQQSLAKESELIDNEELLIGGQIQENLTVVQQQMELMKQSPRIGRVNEGTPLMITNQDSNRRKSRRQSRFGGDQLANINSIQYRQTLLNNINQVAKDEKMDMFAEIASPRKASAEIFSGQGFNVKDGILQDQGEHNESKELKKKPNIPTITLPPISYAPQSISYAKISNGSGVLESKNNEKQILSKAKQIIETNKLNQQIEDEKKSKKLELDKIIENDEVEPQFKETKVGTLLSELTTRRVIILVMSIMFSIPIFSPETYMDAVVSYDMGLNSIYMFTNSTDDYISASMEAYLDYHQEINLRNPVVYTELYTLNSSSTCCQKYPNDKFRFTSVDYTKLRDDEVNLFPFVDIRDGSTVALAIVDVRKDYSLNAILSIIRTIFVSIVLGAGAMVFSKDVEDFIVSPIEKMLEKVQRIAENPLIAAQMEENDALALEELEKKGVTKELLQRQEEDKYETAILEKLLIKTGALLALVFGEAGSVIIAENMSKGDEINPMLAGKKMMGIFGFVEIRQFSDATEVLQTGIMLYVNEIAEILHATVDSFCGQTNKNIGEIFLLCWKYEEELIIRKPDGSVQLVDEQKVKEFSDLPVLCFIRTIIAINMSKKLDRYKDNEQLNAKISNYSVKLGFGLHVGWGIEGAIGSNFKIDASYLSPNVNMSSRLEAATKQFGVYILLSGPLYKLLTEKCQRNLRHIDTVTVKGSLVPLEFYTVDMFLDNMYKKCIRNDKFDNSELTVAQKKKKRVLERMKRNKLRKEIFNGERHIADLFITDKEIVVLMEIFTKQFYETWEIGFKAYIDGDWPKALKYFSQTQNMLPTYKDGPSTTLMKVITENNGQAPNTWKGFRVLTEK